MSSIYARALEKWDTAAQVTQTMGECGELIAALQKFFFQGRAERRNLDDLIDELVDVKVMVEQMEIIVGPQRVRDRMAEKLDILEDRLKGGE